jgi:UDP-3-O-[3-hydroxymyristoyl] glucosamine N-acyltransferase
VIGDNTVLYPGVKIYHDCQIGKNCIVHAGSVIGADGFGFAPRCETNNYKKIPQVGNVILEDNVEIGANTTIDRATMGSTIIREGVKLDNLIQVGHNAEIGQDSVIAAQSGIAGSSKVGKYCMFGGQVGLSGHLNVADKVKVAAQSGIASNINTEGEIVQGSPAYNFGQYKRSYVYFKKLPGIYKQINDIEKQIEELKKNISKK